MPDDAENGWPSYRLDRIVDFNPRETLPKGTNAPYIEMASLPQDGRWHEEPAIRAASSGSRFRDGDTLLARITPCLENGKTAQVRGLGPEAVGWGSTEFIVMRAKLGVSDPDFVYLLAREPGFREYAIQQMTGTSGRQRVPTESVASFVVPLPPLEEQRRIAEVLGAVYDRIESAARLETVLGEAVIAEYELALLNRANNEVLSLVDAVSLINGGAYTKGADGTGRMVIRIKELNSGPSESTVYSSIVVPDNKTAYPGDVLFAWSGSLGVWRWYREEAIVNQHIFKVLPKKHPVWLGSTQILGELERFQDIAAGKATTMGHITKDHLERTMVPTFSAEELEVLSARVEPLWDAQLQAGRELHTLQTLRSQLLPLLISGELRIAAAEELVESVS
jgi:type I restriction enzyme S subunit